ncbi:MAG TPA: tetratricopeptide repeat protein [Candidatus Eisenbacteria bacterium]|nr:tetratricopeptide repeat protein [Candidatus Eisenbacteria bacterium]
MNRFVAWAVKNKAAAALAAGLGASLLAMPFVARQSAENSNARLRDVAVKAAALQAENGKLKKDYQSVSTDRDNILKQTKALFAEKEQMDALRQANEDLTKANETITKQKDSLHRDNQTLRQKGEAAAKQLDALKTAQLKTKGDLSAAETENKTLKTALQRSVEQSPQYQKLTAESRAIKEENDTLKKTVQALDQKLKSTLDRIKKIQDRDLKFAKQADGLKAETAKIKQERDKLKATNNEMNKLVEDAPRKFQAMAAENKKLTAETANMHYNLGVFFSQQRNYERAVKEFERALEFDPNMANAHYNLGYLYSERLERHDLALAHFNRFLEINPSAKESEVVRSYILLRQSYGDRPVPEKQKGELKFR